MERDRICLYFSSNILIVKGRILHHSRMNLPCTEVLCTEMGTITELFMCGFLLKVHNNFFSKNVPIARTRGLDYGISPVQVMYLLEIHH